VANFRIVVAAIIVAAAPFAVYAQDIEPDPPEDPLNTTYGMGNDASDAELIARAPKFANYRAFLPPRVDLSDRLPRPGDQGNVGSCSSWAIGYAARAYYTNFYEGRSLNRSENIPSPGFLYAIARNKSSPASCKQGSSLGENVNVLAAGALSLKEFPYSRSNGCLPAPSASVIASARDFKVDGLVVLNAKNIEDIRGKLAQGDPVVITFHTSRSFHRLRGSRTYDDPTFVNKDDDLNGWHAMTLVGYDDSRQAFRLINSWGRGWGDHGYAWISYSLFQPLVREAITLKVTAPVKPEPLPGPPAPSPTPEPKPAPPPAAKLDLVKYACARLATRPASQAPIIDGFVSTDADLDDLKRQASAAGAQLGEVKVAAWPQCEALLTLDRALHAGGQPAIDIGGKTELAAGDALPVKVTTPPSLSYVYVSYIQADGSVVHLVQPRGVVPTTTLPNQTLLFGDGAEGRQKFTIDGPFGRELIIAIASKSPLFDAPLPEKQNDREYLSTLRRALVYKADPSQPDRQLSASLVSISTKEAVK
jgi:hypothetical protein